MPAFFLVVVFVQENIIILNFPIFFNARKYNITILEMFAIIICLKLCGNNFKGNKLQMFCDNQVVCHVINTGKSKCTILQACYREIAFLAACYEFQIRMVHLSSECNHLSDHLSRWDLDISHRQKFFDLVKRPDSNREYSISRLVPFNSYLVMSIFQINN